MQPDLTAMEPWPRNIVFAHEDLDPNEAAGPTPSQQPGGQRNPHR